jgi:hypothetical protein
MPHVILPGKMPTDDIVGDGQKTLVRTDGALDAGFHANARNPLVATSGRITRLASSATLEAARIDVVASAKERAKQVNLGAFAGASWELAPAFAARSFVVVPLNPFWEKSFSAANSISCRRTFVISLTFRFAVIADSHYHARLVSIH